MKPVGPRPGRPLRTTASSEITPEILDLVQVAARRRLAPGFWRGEVRLAVDVVTDDLVAEINGYVYGRSGPAVTAAKVYYETNFPRWIPRRLRNRWSRRRSIEIDATPMLLWPDATLAPSSFGTAVRVLRVDRHYDRL